MEFAAWALGGTVWLFVAMVLSTFEATADRVLSAWFALAAVGGVVAIACSLVSA